MKRVCVAAAAIILGLRCAAVEMAPSKTHPVPMCVITCPWGYRVEEQHTCRSGTRWFQDVLVVGEHTVRGADGMKLSDVWITINGDFPKVDCVRGSCGQFIAGNCIMPGSNCAAHPGEPDPKHPFGGRQ